MRRENSNIVEQTPILHAALEKAREALPNTRVRDITWQDSEYTLEFDFVTEYDPSLCSPGLPPIARTKGEWNAFLSKGDAASEVQKGVADHQALLDDVYAGKYAA